MIDSEQLESGDALDRNFRKMAADQIERFRREIIERTGDRKQATIAIVNPTREARTLKLDIRGGSLASTGRRYVIAADDPMACNEPGKRPAVTIRDSVIGGFDPAAITVLPLSISLTVLDVTRR